MDFTLPLPGSFQEHFSSLKDSRIARTRKYSLVSLFFMAFSSVLAGCQGWDDRYLTELFCLSTVNAQNQ